jgi:hypothetical protein
VRVLGPSEFFARAREDGTFQWRPQPGKEGPTLTDGKFHAVRKD